MKHFSIFLSILLLLLVGGVQTTTAQQDDSNWETYAKNPEDLNGNYVYLYNVTQHAFLNAGGDYGMCGIMNPRGIRLTLEKSNENYCLKSPVINKARGSYISIQDDKVYSRVVYIDRARDNRAIFNLKNINDSFAFKIHNTETNTYLKYFPDKHFVADTGSENEADVWCFITIKDYQELTQQIAQVGNYNVSGLLYNTRFIRNVSNKDNLFWKTTGLTCNESDYCTAIDENFGTTDEGGNDKYAREYGSYGCLEIGRAIGKFYQEITNLQPGLYKVSAQAFFDVHDEAPCNDGAYSENNPASTTNAYLFANDQKEPIKELTEEQYKDFKAIVEKHEAETSHESCKNYFRRNVPASVYMTGSNTFEPDESSFVVEVFVLVEDGGTLRLGVDKTAEGGRVYMDNMTLTYMGNPKEYSYGFGVDAYGDYDAVDNSIYRKDGYMFYLSRKFVESTTGHGWNALTLPVNLSSSQLRGTFGEKMELVKLIGLNEQNPQQIFFEPVNLDGGEGLEAGKCYLVKVTNGPIGSDDDTQDNAFKFNRITEGDDESYYKPEEVIYQYGNIYQFNGVSCPNGISNGTVTGTTDDGALKWTTYYYYPADNGKAAPAGSYIMSGGDMYHLDSEWTGLIGTAWYIEETNPSTESKTFVIDNGNGTTDINGIVTETPAGKAAEGVYTINGQKVASDKSLNDLPKGIYIVNGKKYIVR